MTFTPTIWRRSSMERGSAFVPDITAPSRSCAVWMSRPPHGHHSTCTTTRATSTRWSQGSSRRARYSAMSQPNSSAEISALYQELILDHYRRPRNKGTLEKPDASVEMKNPLCGDEIGLQVEFDGSAVHDLKFSGRGCSISQASASMMTQLVKGKSRDEIDVIRNQFRDLMLGVTSAEDESRLGSLRSLSGVARFPARVKCALLAWNALESALEGQP